MLIPTWHTLVTNLLWLGADDGVVSVVLAQIRGGIIKALRRDLALRA